jgi:hypothetical protein
MSRFLFISLAALLLLCSCQADTGTPAVAAPEPPPAAESVPAADEAPAADEGSPDVSGNVFGQPITITEAIAAADVIAKPGDYLGKPILVRGEVVDICQAMGCWMVITDGESGIRVTTKGHDFFVRKDGTGSMALVQGTLKHVAPDAERTAHLKGESAKPDQMPEKAGFEYEIEAAGVVFSETPKTG